MKPAKKLVFSLMAFFAFATITAQTEKPDTRQDEIDDKIQQEPPRETQRAVENSARQADVNAKAAKNDREAEDKLKKEKEQSTGKEAKNPAETNPTTVKPVKLSDPVSAPPNSGNR